MGRGPWGCLRAKAGQSSSIAMSRPAPLRSCLRHGRSDGALTARLGHGHHFQQVAVRVLEVETAAAATSVSLAVGVAVWPAAVRDTLRFHPGQDCVELGFVDVEGVVMALAGPWIEARATPRLSLVGEVKGQGVVDLYLREMAMARLDLQPEDLGEELSRGNPVLRRHDGVV